MQPLVFFGSDQISRPIMGALIEYGWPIAVVVTQPDRPSGRGQQLASSPIKQLADQHGISTLQPSRLTEIEPELHNFGTQFGVLASYGKLIPASTLALFPDGIINIHPSLLPHYRGPAPIEAAIKNGDTETGVTLMRLEVKMDAGPIFSQERLGLTGRETQPQLYGQLAELGAQLLLRDLVGIISGKIPPQQQDEAKATYTQLIKKSDGEIDWSRSAKEIEHQVRAYLNWPGSRTMLGNREVILTATHVQSEAEGLEKQLSHKTGDGILIIDRLKPAGRREMTGLEFLAGQH